jgi:hypothetical protein
LYLAIHAKTERHAFVATPSEFMQVLVYELPRTPLLGTW